MLLALVALTAASCGGGDSDGLPRDAARGRALARDLGCTGCHSTDGSRRTGPTWKGIWGTEVQLGDGARAVVDDAYVIESIREPSVKVVDGFNAVMPPFALDSSELDSVIAYIRSLGPVDAGP